MEEKEYLKTLNEIKTESGEFINIVSSFCEYINKECMNNGRGGAYRGGGPYREKRRGPRHSILMRRQGALGGSGVPSV